jgi:hypothetical protein
METDADILAAARTAIAEFGLDAAREMEQRSQAHERAGEVAGMSYWRRVADAVRQFLSGTPQ